MRPLRGSWPTDIFLGLIVTAAIGGTVSLIVFTVPGTLSVGETVQASAVIGLVVVTIFYVVFTRRMSAAALEDAKASREQAEVAKRQLGRDYEAEFIAQVIDPFMEQVQGRRLDLMSSTLGWEPVTSRGLGSIPLQSRGLFESHLSVPNDNARYFFPYASQLDVLPANLTLTGLRRFHQLDEHVITELNVYKDKVQLWRRASSKLALQIAQILGPLWERRPERELVYTSQNTNWNLRPYITYVVYLTLVRPNQFDRRSATAQEDYGNTPVAQSMKFYGTHSGAITDELGDLTSFASRSRLINQSTDALIASLEKIEASLNSRRSRLTAEYQLSEEFITGFRERQQRRQESDLLV